VENLETELDETRSQLEDTRLQLEDTRSQLEDTRSQLEETRCKLRKLRQETKQYLHVSFNDWVDQWDLVEHTRQPLSPGRDEDAAQLVRRPPAAPLESSVNQGRF